MEAKRPNPLRALRELRQKCDECLEELNQTRKGTMTAFMDMLNRHLPCVAAPVQDMRLMGRVYATNWTAITNFYLIAR